MNSLIYWYEFETTETQVQGGKFGSLIHTIRGEYRCDDDRVESVWGVKNSTTTSCKTDASMTFDFQKAIVQMKNGQRAAFTGTDEEINEKFKEWLILHFNP